MSITYQEGAKCLLKHCHDLQGEPQGCKRKFVRSTILIPHTNGVTRIFSKVNGPAHESFECSGEKGSCGCVHAEQRALKDLLIYTGDHSHFQYIMLCTFSPCTQCTNAIVESKTITAVVCDKITEHDLRGWERLNSVIPVLTVRRLEEIAGGSHRGELCFIKRWS